MNPRSILLAVLISLIVTTGCAGKGIADLLTVQIPDPNFESTVRSILKKPTGDLIPADLANFSSLGLREVTSLEGIQYFVYLQNLTITNSPDVDLSPIHSLQNLTWLWIRYSPGINIEPIHNMNFLEVLQIRKCGLTDISPLEGLSNLERLDLEKNGISDLTPLRNLKSLTRLTLRYNVLVDIGALSTLTNLEVCQLDYNFIEDIYPLSNLTQLIFLGLPRNQIKDLSGLVDNPGLGQEYVGYGRNDRVVVNINPLSEHAINVQIPILEARGVDVNY
ncbi:leucine-rich repeat domain-containing protein [bacterium]|nr:leucine-rich repeat domain-containing protein [bacterium]